MAGAGSGRQGDVAVARGVDHEDIGAGHLAAFAETDPLGARGSLELEEDGLATAGGG